VAPLRLRTTPVSLHYLKGTVSMPKSRSLQLRSLRCTALLLAVCATVIATGCSAQKTDHGKVQAQVSAFPAPPVSNISPGVTDREIKIGIVYPDLASVRQFVNIDQGDYEGAYNALIKDINSKGGIDGRMIVPVYGKINLLSPGAAQETCLKLTQDEKVFAVLGSFNGDEPLCYVQANRTATIGGQLTARRYALAKAPWFSFLRGGDEVADGIALFNSNHELTGKKVAVISNVEGRAVMNETVIPALHRIGVTPVQTGVLDAPASDAAAVNQQIGVFVEKFQAAGADTVVVVGSMGAGFPPVLEHTQYRPRLLFTDLGQVSAYTGDKGKHDFSTLTNAEALGLNGPWITGGTRECVATVEAANPSLKGKIVDPSTVPAGSPQPGVSLAAACQNLKLFTAIARKAGKDLNYQTFENAGFSLGSVEIPGFGDAATYTRDTPHGDIPARVFKYNPATHKFPGLAS